MFRWYKINRATFSEPMPIQNLTVAHPYPRGKPTGEHSPKILVPGKRCSTHQSASSRDSSNLCHDLQRGDDDLDRLKWNEPCQSLQYPAITILQLARRRVRRHGSHTNQDEQDQNYRQRDSSCFVRALAAGEAEARGIPIAANRAVCYIATSRQAESM